jgi:hypothetical protein
MKDNVILSHQDVTVFWSKVVEAGYDYRLFHQLDQEAETIARSIFGTTMWEERLTEGDYGGLVFKNREDAIAWVSVRDANGFQNSALEERMFSILCALIPPKTFLRTSSEIKLLANLRMLLETTRK